MRTDAPSLPPPRAFPASASPRKAVKGDTCYGLRTRTETRTDPLGWEDVGDLNAGVIFRRITDDTLPGGSIERTIE